MIGTYLILDIHGILSILFCSFHHYKYEAEEFIRDERIKQ